MTRKAMTRKCQLCCKRPATWIMQYVASDKPSFTLPGSHYRGFATTRLCDVCKEGIIQEGYLKEVQP